ncbi:MAG: ABC transporter permease [Bacillota bacterium]|nr:ABC transporter permease [Bacillota bacterium]
MKKLSISMPLLVFIIVIALWELAVKLFNISLYILPPPSKIFMAIVDNFDVLWAHSLVTLSEALIGLFISTILAIGIAICMDLSKTFKKSVYPYLIVTQTVPVMVLGPLFSIWLGFGMAPKVLIVIFMCFFPIAISFCDSLGQVDKNQINLLKSFKASTWQIYTMVKIPSGAIGLFSGLKVASTYCIGGAIVGEWLSSSAGLGYYMLRVKNGYMLDKVFACVVMIILWSVLLNLSCSLIQYLAFPHLRKKGKQ